MSANILVVDDEAAVRDMLSQWLTTEGYHCASAGAASEALDVIDRGPGIDVALLDLAMPGEDGVWLARRLRERQDDLALIMCTGWQSFDAAVEGMRIGILDYLLKPFTRVELMEAVQRGLKWREQTRQAREERSRLEAVIEKRSLELAEAFGALEAASSSAIEALLVTFNTRNPDAFEHARRVARMSASLGAALGVREPVLTQVEHGALLHDIGKIAMPDSLIHKPGPLTEEEIGIIRTHPQIGYEIVRVVPNLAGAAEIILASHEAFDGSGYPKGLKGDEIPIGSRITAVTDTFDALTWSRVYRDPVSVTHAAAELVRCAGAQFDPDVVHAWLRIVEAEAMEATIQ